MTDVLLISSSLENINVAWRHFCYSEYNASATTNISAAMENLKSSKPARIVVYYCSEDTEGFYSLYNTLRSDPKTADIPLLVLADVSWQKALTDYVKFYNTCILGISVNDEKLKDMVKSGARHGFEKKSPAINRTPPKRTSEHLGLRANKGR